jgi:hypothetical protein
MVFVADNIILFFKCKRRYCRMKKGKLLFSVTALLMAVAMFSLSACAQKQTKTSASSTDSASGIFGKVTAIDGDKITLALVTMSMPGGRPTGTIPKDGSRPSGTIPQDGQQPGGLSDLLTLTGESKTFTIDDTTVISRMSRQGPGGLGPGGRPGSGTTSSSTSTDSTTAPTEAAATLADITVGSILVVTYDESSGKLTSVQIMNSGFPPG